MIDTVEAATGQAYSRHSLGTVDDLRQIITGTRRANNDPAAPVMLMYMLFMLTGQTASPPAPWRHQFGPEILTTLTSATTEQWSKPLPA
ncbi:MAG TPA: hypothetical protein VIY28_06050 [Pseudonocardiaceae bacterium]